VLRLCSIFAGSDGGQLGDSSGESEGSYTYCGREFAQQTERPRDLQHHLRLCLMQASWMSVGDDMRSVLLRSLRDDMVFADDLPQVTEFHLVLDNSSFFYRLHSFLFLFVNATMLHVLTFNFCAIKHIANSLWALAKMDAAWSDLPAAVLEEAFRRCADNLTSQVDCR